MKVTVTKAANGWIVQKAPPRGGPRVVDENGYPVQEQFVARTDEEVIAILKGMIAAVGAPASPAKKKAA